MIEEEFQKPIEGMDESEDAVEDIDLFIEKIKNSPSEKESKENQL